MCKIYVIKQLLNYCFLIYVFKIIVYYKFK